MTKKLLLVDDEELFLRSLKEGLQSLSHIFETDICNSVNEAIKHIITKKYDLIITDMRMPGKSGLELLVYLRDIKYAGKIMVMSAFNTEDNTKRIKSYGVVEVISKPFNLEWFKTKIKEVITTEETDGANQVTFEAINLVTVMQIINMERKSSVLEVKMPEGTGVIYFENGEIIHSQFLKLEGERAVLKLIAMKQGPISIKPFVGNVRRTMQLPFVEQLMKIMSTIDELRRDQNKAPEEHFDPFPEPKPDPRELENETPQLLTAEDNGDTIPETEQMETKKNLEVKGKQMKEKIATLKDVKGYLGAGVFTPQGEMLEGTADISGVQFEEAGSLIHDTLKDAKDMTREIGFGNMDMIQLYTQMGIIFAKCYNDGTKHFHTILVIKSDGNIAMARIKLNKVVEQLISEF